MSLIFAPDTIELFAQAELGEVEQTITTQKRGRVRFMATYWFARFYQPNGQRSVLPGTPVKVIGIEGITLLVVLMGDEVTQPQMPVADPPEPKQVGLLGMLKKQLGK